jgi:hypothetical protein
VGLYALQCSGRACGRRSQGGAAGSAVPVQGHHGKPENHGLWSVWGQQRHWRHHCCLDSVTSPGHHPEAKSDTSQAAINMIRGLASLHHIAVLVFSISAQSQGFCRVLALHVFQSDTILFGGIRLVTPITHLQLSLVEHQRNPVRACVWRPALSSITGRPSGSGQVCSAQSDRRTAVRDDAHALGTRRTGSMARKRTTCRCSHADRPLHPQIDGTSPHLQSTHRHDVHRVPCARGVDDCSGREVQQHGRCCHCAPCRMSSAARYCGSM